MLYVIGLGPGKHSLITPCAKEAIEKCNVITGYTVYIDLIKDLIEGKDVLTTPMKQEVKRCQLAVESALQGNEVAMVCSGDAGVYGMAGLIYEVCQKLDVKIDIEVIPGVTAATSAAAILGAPLIHDFAIISLSDLMTPLDDILRRVDYASKAGFVIVIYNPSSKKRFDYLSKACWIIAENTKVDLNCGYVRNIGRDNEESKILKLSQLKDEQVDMFTTVIIGNENTKIINDKLVTPRGYRI